MKSFICIECPKGCSLTIDDNLNVTGNTCPRGALYAKNEVTNPMRMLTSTVKLQSENLERLPVITSAPIPKKMMFDIMTELAKVEVSAPIEVKQVVVSNILGTGVDIVASRTIEK